MARHPLPYAFAREHLWLLEDDGQQLTLTGCSTPAASSDEQQRRLSALTEIQRRHAVQQVHWLPADELAQRIEAMQAMQRTLDHLIHCCHGDGRPDCPILDDLAQGAHGSH